jgi:hypothetical protein
MLGCAFAIWIASASPARAQEPYRAGAPAYPPSRTATAPAAEPLTLADPALREILSHFKYPGDGAGYSASGRSRFLAATPIAPAPPGYAEYSFGAVRPYWPPVVVGQPPTPMFPFAASPFVLSPFAFGRFLAPFAAPALLFPPAIDFISPGR